MESCHGLLRRLGAGDDGVTRKELVVQMEKLAEERRTAASVHIRDIGAQHIFALLPDILAALRDEGRGDDQQAVHADRVQGGL